MKNRWPLIVLMFVIASLSFGGGYAVGADCPKAKASLSAEALVEIAETCLSNCQTCPDPCAKCPTCPDCECPPQVTPEPCSDGDVLLVPEAASTAPYRLELLLMASEDGKGAGAVWRPHRRLWRLTSVGVVWQDHDSREFRHAPSYDKPHTWPGGESVSVVATVGLW